MFEVHIVEAEIEGDAKATIESRACSRNKIEAVLCTRRDPAKRESEARACLGCDVIQKILCPHGHCEEYANNCREKDALHLQLLYPRPEHGSCRCNASFSRQLFAYSSQCPCGHRIF